MKEEEGAKIESSLKEKGDLLNHFRVLGFGILDGGFGIRDFCGLLFYVLGFCRTRNKGVVVVEMPDDNVNYWKDGSLVSLTISTKRTEPWTIFLDPNSI